MQAGFPFDDDMITRGHQNIRSHLDDLAQRHPEFADHLRCPPWGGEVDNSHSFGRNRRGSNSGSFDEDPNQGSTASGSSTESPIKQETEERGRGRPGNLNHHGLRNTVDLGQQQHQESEEKQGRGQRSMSAPPDNRAKQQPPRFVSRLEINPVNPADPTSGGGPSTVTSDNLGKPPMAPKQPQMPSKQQQSGNVRHIPIFVEGRDEPLLPKVDPEHVEQVFSEPNVEQVFPQMQHGYSRPRFSSQNPFYPQQQPQTSRNFQQQQMAPPSPKQQRHGKPSPSPPPPPPPPPQQQQQQTPPPQQAQSPNIPTANDPISRVQVIAKDVADLQAKVGVYSGSSRKDKDYIYLDEMLTRNLLKLDDIETEGKDNVRQARKEVIKTIQRCISILETKVPNPEEESKLPEENRGEEENKNLEQNNSKEEPMQTETVESKDTVPIDTVEEAAGSAEGTEPPVEAEGESKSEVEKGEVAEVKTEQLPMEVEESKQTDATVTNAKDSALTEETKAASNTQSEAEQAVPTSDTKSS